MQKQNKTNLLHQLKLYYINSWKAYLIAGLILCLLFISSVSILCSKGNADNEMSIQSAADADQSLENAYQPIKIDYSEIPVNPDECGMNVFLESIQAANIIEYDINPGRYDPEWILDDDASSALGMRFHEDTKPEIKIRFSHTTCIDGLVIRNGLAANQSKYRNNARIKSMTIITDNQRRILFVNDNRVAQVMNFIPVSGKSVTIRINEIYYNDQDSGNTDESESEDEASADDEYIDLYLSDLIFEWNYNPVIYVNHDELIENKIDFVNSRYRNLINILTGKVFHETDSYFRDPTDYHFYTPSGYCFHSGSTKLYDPCYDEQGFYKIYSTEESGIYLMELTFDAKKHLGAGTAYFSGMRDVKFSYSGGILNIIEDNLWTDDYEGRYSLNEPEPVEEEEAEGEEGGSTSNQPTSEEMEWQQILGQRRYDTGNSVRDYNYLGSW